MPSSMWELVDVKSQVGIIPVSAFGVYLQIELAPCWILGAGLQMLMDVISQRLVT